MANLSYTCSDHKHGLTSCRDAWSAHIECRTCYKFWEHHRGETEYTEVVEQALLHQCSDAPKVVNSNKDVAPDEVAVCATTVFYHAVKEILQGEKPKSGDQIQWNINVKTNDGWVGEVFVRAVQP